MTRDDVLFHAGRSVIWSLIALFFAAAFLGLCCLAFHHPWRIER